MTGLFLETCNPTMKNEILLSKGDASSEILSNWPLGEVRMKC